MADDPQRARLAHEVLLNSFLGPDDGNREQWAIDRVVQHIEEVEVNGGDALFRAGDPSDYLYFVTDGLVKLSAEGHPDWVYRGDWVIGTTDMLVGRTRARTATAQHRFTAFRIPARVWIDITREDFSLTTSAVMGSARGNERLYLRLAPGGGFASAPDRRIRFDEEKASFLDRAVLLHRTAYLRRAGVQALVDIARQSEIERFAAGDTIFASGRSPRRIGLVVSGEAEVSREDPLVVGRFHPGSVIGGAISLGNEDSAWSARAVTDSVVLSIDRRDWFDTMEDHPSIGYAAMADLALEREALLDLAAAPTGEIVLD